MLIHIGLLMDIGRVFFSVHGEKFRLYFTVLFLWVSLQKISKIRKGEHMWLVIKVEGMDWSINQCRKVKEKLIQWYFWSPDSRKNKKVISKAVYIFLKAEKIEKLFLTAKGIQYLESWSVAYLKH